MDRTIPQGHFLVADGLRGIAVLATMIFHVQYFAVTVGTSLWERAYSLGAGLGWAGVDLFFVLSGFLITGILYDSRMQPHYYRVFYLRRTVRILPLYYGALLVIFLLLPMLMRAAHVPLTTALLGTPAAQLSAWTYTINWDLAVQGFGFISPLVAHFWSLSVEEQFYLAWPAVVRGVWRRGLMTLCMVMIVLAVVVRLLLFRWNQPTAAYVLPFARMDGLAVGALIALAARDARDWATARRWAPTVTLVSGAAFAGLVASTSTTAFGDPYIGTVGISLLCLCFGGSLVVLLGAPAEGRARKLVSCEPLRWFGKYSYCLYVVNQPATFMLAKLGITAVGLHAIFHSRPLDVLGVNVIGIAVCAIIAFGSWHLFEKQWLSLKMRPAFNHPGISPTLAAAKAV